MDKLSKTQLTTILSALTGKTCKPANSEAALKALDKHAEALALDRAAILSAAPGLLDGRLSPEEWLAELTEPETEPAPKVATRVIKVIKAQPAAEPEALEETATAILDQDRRSLAARAAARKAAPKAKAKPAKPAKAKAKPVITKPTAAREASKKAMLIEMLRRGEGVSTAEIMNAFGWQAHTCRSLISTLKKGGLPITAEYTREVGPNRTGAKGSTTRYRLPA